MENDIILEGYLKKWTNVITGWRERFFTLKQGGILNFVDKQGKDKGTIYLKIANIKLTPKDPLKITIHSGLKELNLRASSIIDKYRWVSALREAAFLSNDTMNSTNRSPTTIRKNSQLSPHKPSISGGLDTGLNLNFKQLFEYENQILGIIAFLLDRSVSHEIEDQLNRLHAIFKEMMKVVLEWKDTLAAENERLERMKEKLDGYFDSLDNVRVNVDDGFGKPESLATEDRGNRPQISKFMRSQMGESPGESFAQSSEIQVAVSSGQIIPSGERLLTFLEGGEKKNNELQVPGRKLPSIPDEGEYLSVNTNTEKSPNKLRKSSISTTKDNIGQQSEGERSIHQHQSPGINAGSPAKEETVSSHKLAHKSPLGSPEIKINGRTQVAEEEEKKGNEITRQENKVTTANEVSEDDEFYSCMNPPAVSKIIRTLNDKTMEGGTMFQTIHEDDMHSFAQDEEVKLQTAGDEQQGLQVLRLLKSQNSLNSLQKPNRELHPIIQHLLDDNPAFKDDQIPYSARRSGFSFNVADILAEKDMSWAQINNLEVPISFHEPLSFLQRLCEQFEYSELLDEADSINDSLLRMAYVIAFTLSGYNTTSRRLTKPFDSLVGETFEFCSEEGDFKYIAEQVSPTLTAFYASSENFELDGSLSLKPEFLGRCIEVKPEGRNELRLKKTGDSYIFTRPITSVDRIQSGKYCISNYGEIKFKNTKKQENAIISLVKRGRDDNRVNIIEGFIKDSKNEFIYKVIGKWDEEISIEHVKTKEVKQVWKRKILNDVDSNFGFTHMALQLNYLNKDLLYQVPPTDSRFRPDVRALEKGDYNLAASENKRLKERQQKLLKSIKRGNVVFKPKWFETLKAEKDAEAGYYVFNNKYFSEKLKDKDVIDLYSELEDDINS